MADVEEIRDGDELIAIIIPSDFSSEGLHFFTPGDFPQQLGFIHRKRGDSAQNHIHNPVKRTIELTQEVLYVKKGRVKAMLFTKNKEYLCDKILATGDLIMLASGGHGFEFLEDTELIEVKQGPYLEEDDKERF